MKQFTIEDEPQTQSLDQVYESFRAEYDNILSKCREFNHCSILISYYTDFKQCLRSKLQQLNPDCNLYTQLKQLDQESDDQEEIIQLQQDYEEFRKPANVQPIKQFKQFATKNNPKKKKTVKLCESVMLEDITEIPKNNLDLIQEDVSEDKISKQIIEFKQNIEEEELNNIEQQIKNAINLYEEALLDQAYHIMRKIYMKLNSKQAIWFQVQGYLDFYEDLQEKITILNQNLTELDSGGWIIEKQSQNQTIKYKLFPDSTVTVYLDSVFPANITKLMALINEIDLYSQYVPFCQQSSMNKQLTKTCKICDIIVYFPFIQNRRAIFVGEGIDRLNINGTIVFVCKSIDNNINYQEKHNIQYKKSKKLVNLIINFYIFELTPLSENQCRVRAITNSNPQVKFLPNWLIGYLARKMANELFERMEKITKNFEKSPWFQKYNENIEFYNWIDKKVQKHFELRQKQ